MQPANDIQKLNLSAWELPINEQKITEPINITEIIILQLTFLMTSDFANFSNENITCSATKNICLINSPYVAARAFWDPREQCFGPVMRNDIITNAISGITGFRRGNTLYDREIVKKPLWFRTSQNFHDCNPYIPKSTNELFEDMKSYKDLNTTISFPIYDLTTPFGKPKQKFFGLPYRTNIILNTRFSAIIDQVLNESETK